MATIMKLKMKKSSSFANRRDALILGDILSRISRLNLLGDTEKLVEQGTLPAVEFKFFDGNGNADDNCLRLLLERTGVVDAVKWRTATSSLLAFSHLYVWLQELPTYFRELGHFLFVKEQRPMLKFKKKYGLIGIQREAAVDLTDITETKQVKVVLTTNVTDEVLSSMEEKGYTNQHSILNQVSSADGTIDLSVLCPEGIKSTSRQVLMRLVELDYIRCFRLFEGRSILPQVTRAILDFGHEQLHKSDQYSQWSTLSRHLDKPPSDDTSPISLDFLGPTGASETDIADAMSWFESCPDNNNVANNTDETRIRHLGRAVRFLCLALPDHRRDERISSNVLGFLRSHLKRPEQ